MNFFDTLYRIVADIILVVKLIEQEISKYKGRFNIMKDTN
jgi:hypothetical protein